MAELKKLLELSYNKNGNGKLEHVGETKRVVALAVILPRRDSKGLNQHPLVKVGEELNKSVFRNVGIGLKHRTLH